MIISHYYYYYCHFPKLQSSSHVNIISFQNKHANMLNKQHAIATYTYYSFIIEYFSFVITNI